MSIQAFAELVGSGVLDVTTTYIADLDINHRLGFLSPAHSNHSWVHSAISLSFECCHRDRGLISHGFARCVLGPARIGTVAKSDSER